MKLDVYSNGTGRELIGVMTKKQAQRYAERNIDPALKRVGFKASVFESDPVIHGGHYYIVCYGKNC